MRSLGTMRNPGSRELRRRQARLESQQRNAVREQTQPQRREESIRRGGLLEGLAPQVVMRLALVIGVSGIILIAAGVLGLLVEMGQHDVPLGILVLLLALAMVSVAGSVAAPALRAVRRDRKVPPRNVQGQLVGASPISATPGLCTLALSVGRNVEQYRIRPELFDKVRNGATVVGISVSPSLNYVQTLTVIRRDRLAAMTEPTVNRAMKVSVWLPLVSVGGVVVALGLAGLIGTLLPLGTGLLHPLVTLLVAAALAGVVALGARWYGNRLVRELGLVE